MAFTLMIAYVSALMNVLKNTGPSAPPFLDNHPTPVQMEKSNEPANQPEP